MKLLFIIVALLIGEMKILFCALIFVLLYFQTCSSLFTMPITREQLAEMAKEKTNYFMDKVLTFISESSNILCTECFKRDISKMFWCLSQAPWPNRVDFIRRRCPIKVNLYSEIVNKHMKQ